MTLCTREAIYKMVLS